jgi:hypothetical protein
MALLTQLMTASVPHPCVLSPKAPRALADLALQLLDLAPAQRPDLHAFIQRTSHWLNAVSDAARSTPFTPALDSARPEPGLGSRADTVSIPPPPPPMAASSRLARRPHDVPAAHGQQPASARARLVLSLLAAVLVAGVAAYARSRRVDRPPVASAELGVLARAQAEHVAPVPQPAAVLHAAPPRPTLPVQSGTPAATHPSVASVAPSAPTQGADNAPAAERRATAVTVGASWAPVRSSPAPDASVVCSVPRGTALPVLDQQAYMSHGRLAHWFVIRCDADTTGWVHENHLASIVR